MHAVFFDVALRENVALAHPLEDFVSLLLIDKRLLAEIFADAEDELVIEIAPVAVLDTFSLHVILDEVLADAVEDAHILLVGDSDALRVTRAAVIEGNELVEVHAVIFELNVPRVFDVVITAEGVVSKAVADIVGPRTPAPLKPPPPPKISDAEFDTVLDGDAFVVTVAVLVVRAEADPPLPRVGELELDFDVVDDVDADAESDFDLNNEAVAEDEDVTEMDDLLECEALEHDVSVAVFFDEGAVLVERVPEGDAVLVREELVDTVAV